MTPDITTVSVDGALGKGCRVTPCWQLLAKKKPLRISKTKGWPESRILQPWHGWRLGLYHSWHAVPCGIFICIPGIYPLDARSNAHSCDNQKRVHTAPRVPWKTKSPGLDSPCSRWDVVLCVQPYTWCCFQSLSWVWFFATPWMVAHQAPLSMGFPRQEDWSGLPFPPPGDHPHPRTESSCTGRCILYHWATREAQDPVLGLGTIRKNPKVYSVERVGAKSFSTPLSWHMSHGWLIQRGVENHSSSWAFQVTSCNVHILRQTQYARQHAWDSSNFWLPVSAGDEFSDQGGGSHACRELLWPHTQTVFGCKWPKLCGLPRSQPERDFFFHFQGVRGRVTESKEESWGWGEAGTLAWNISGEFFASPIDLTHRYCLKCRRRRFNRWVGKIPRRREWQPTPVLLPGESHG